MRIPIVHYLGIVLLIPSILKVLTYRSTQIVNGTTNPTQITTQPDGTPSDCSGVFVLEKPFDFVPILKCSYLHPGVIAYSIPLFADIDGDDETEIVIMLDFDPNGIAIINPHTCEIEYFIETPDAVNFKDGGAVLGDVDRNGYVDIFFSAGSTIQRWEYNPNTNQMDLIWRTPVGVSLAVRPHLDIWDMNQDGNAEIIPNQGQMVDAVTGYVYPGVLPILNGEGKGVYAFSADAIPGNAPGGQGNVELIYGTHIYRYDFTAEEWILVAEQSTYDWGSFANVSLADMDLDGDVDAVITQWSSIGQALIWDMQTDLLLGGGVYDYPGELGSRMNIANMDDDPHPEMVMTSKFKIFAIDDMINSGGFGNIIWLDNTSDESGHTQLTSFDFNGDGTYEIVYRDETQLRIFNGLGTGIPDPAGYPSMPLVLMDTGDNSCTSLTGLEYPTIGDVDNDNEAEIVVSCQGGIGIYESGALPWGRASKVWNTQAFNVTNVNQDGTIPAIPIENYTVYNNFLAQVNLNPISDTVVLPLPDAIVSVREVIPNCVDSFQLELEICNQGIHEFPKGTPLAIYWGDPTQGPATFIDTLRLGNRLLEGNCVQLISPNYSIHPIQTELYITINDHGEFPLPYTLEDQLDGGDFSITNIRECDYTNNLTSISILGAVATSDTISVSICEGESYDFGGNAFTLSGKYSRTLSSILGCDSTIVLDLTVLEPLEVIDYREICAGESLFFSGRIVTETGSYRDTTISLETGCDSINILFLEVLPAPESFFTVAVCEGESFDYRGNSIAAPGNHREIFTSSLGCDSIVNFEIEVIPPNVSTVTRIICTGESFFSGSEEYSQSGFYREVYGGSNGCDSVFNLNLIVLPTAETQLSQSICPGEQYNFNGQILTEAGTYFDTLSTSRGCDSVLIMNFEVLEVPEVNFTALICNRGSFFYNGRNYSAEGTYENVFTGSNGCDSIVNLKIVKKVPNISFVEHEICEGEIFNIAGNSYSEPGIYTGIIPATDGCDSITLYTLKVYQAYQKKDEATICQGEVYYYQGQEHTRPGTYFYNYPTINGCDSTFTLELAVNAVSSALLDTTICSDEVYLFDGEQILETGQYLSIHPNTLGCDSLTILNIEVLPANPLIAQDHAICSGESVQLMVSGGQGNYRWVPTTGLSCSDCPNPIAKPFKTTTYTIFSTGCLDRPIFTTATVEVTDFPRVELGQDINAEIGEEITINPKFTNYTDGPVIWETFEGIVCEDCTTMTIYPDRTITYTVTVGTPPNCYHSDDITIRVDRNCVEGEFEIPNFISPNGDGFNDEFYIIPNQQSELKSLRIYERWGELIFSGDSFNDHWGWHF